MQKEWLSEDIVMVSRKGNYIDLGLPGGKIEEGETSQEAIIREVKEETGLVIEERWLKLVEDNKPCGDYLVDVYLYESGVYFHDDFVNDERSLVRLGHISECIQDHCSFKQFNQDVWDILVKRSELPWRTIDDVDLDVVINSMMGSCTESIDSVLETYSNGNLDMYHLTGEQLDYIDENVTPCPGCGWNVETAELRYCSIAGEAVCDDCFVRNDECDNCGVESDDLEHHELTGQDLCSDCYNELSDGEEDE